MSNHDSLGDRMKGYESVSRARLVPKMPVLARLDGKAFHTLTRGLDKPYDKRFQRCMWETARHLCERVQGCRIAYVQSDEITLLLVDYDSHQQQGWFDYEVQKMCSIAAATAAVAFGRQYREEFGGLDPLAVFDARFWNLPASEVVNCFIWRQQDATRNSVSGLAQAHFSHRELHGKDGREMQDMLMREKGINWNDCPIPEKRGVCVVRETFEVPIAQPERDGVVVDVAMSAIRHRWVIDEQIPIFTQDRDYIERHVAPRSPEAVEVAA